MAVVAVDAGADADAAADDDCGTHMDADDVEGEWDAAVAVDVSGVVVAADEDGVAAVADTRTA